MKARISDKQVLTSVSPSQVMAYLRARGGKKIDNISSKAVLWKYAGEELLVPRETRYADYASRIADILLQLEEAEDRSQLMIVSDLQNSGFDIIRVRNVSEDTRRGSLNLAHSVAFVAGARDMLLAAACSAATHKISYPGKKPQNAEAFVETVRFGQTAPGSFVLQLLSPVAPDLHIQKSLPGMPEDVTEDIPYEKTVVPTLQSGLEALNAAAQRSSEDGSLEHFQKAAAFGLTTNLCDAVVNMYDGLTPRYIEVSISYSANRRQSRPLARVSVDSGYIPIIREASQTIKATEPEPDQLVRGLVVRLGSEEPRESGEITVKDIVSPSPRSVVVRLDGDEYSKAVEAHRNRQVVEFTGIIVKTGRHLRLEVPSPINIVSAD